jgi:scavenger receptor class B protein 1
MCRSFTARFSGQAAFDDIDTLTFEMDPNIFAAASADPTRACFCTPDDSHCLGNGVLNVSNCHYGAPAIVSQPHFLNADQTYLRAVEVVSMVEG